MRKPVRKQALQTLLEEPPVPAELAYLLVIYQRLRRRKGSGGFGHLPIEWPDIAAFAQFTGLKLIPFEVEILEGLDDAFLASHGNVDWLDLVESELEQDGDGSGSHAASGGRERG